MHELTVTLHLTNEQLAAWAVSTDAQWRERLTKLLDEKHTVERQRDLLVEKLRPFAECWTQDDERWGRGQAALLELAFDLALDSPSPTRVAHEALHLKRSAFRDASDALRSAGFWRTASEASAEVASWPEWKREGCVAGTRGAREASADWQEHGSITHPATGPDEDAEDRAMLAEARAEAAKDSPEVGSKWRSRHDPSLWVTVTTACNDRFGGGVHYRYGPVPGSGFHPTAAEFMENFEPVPEPDFRELLAEAFPFVQTTCPCEGCKRAIEALRTRIEEALSEC